MEAICIDNEGQNSNNQINQKLKQEMGIEERKNCQLFKGKFWLLPPKMKMNTTRARSCQLIMFAVISSILIIHLPKLASTLQATSNLQLSSLRQAPVIVPFVFGQNVQENQRSSVVCKIENGELPISISWFKDGQLLTPPLAKSNKILIKSDVDSSTLRLVPVKLDQAGNYTCVASNKAGSQSHSARLVVYRGSQWPAYNQSNLRTKRSHDTAAGGGEMMLDDSNNSPHHEPLMLPDTSLELGALEPEAEGRQQQPQQQQQQLRGKRTLYACEEKQLQIECQLGESIQLIRANYGRFSIQICNEHGQLDWKVNCMSPASFQIISNSCQEKQSCQLLASNTIFGDSCPGTQKYLEVHYQCVAGGQLAPGTATNRTGDSAHQQLPARTAPIAQRPPNRPPIVIAQPQDFLATTTTTLTSITSAFSERPPTNTVQRWPGDGRPSQLPTWMGDVSLSPPAPQPNAMSSVSGHLSNSSHLCPEMVRRQIRWPQTEAGLVVQMPCPAHALPSSPLMPYAASLACQSAGPSGAGGASWQPRVQAARCQSVWLRNLTKSLDDGDSPLSILSELAQRTRPPNYMQLVGGWTQSFTTAANSGSGGGSSSSGSLFGDDIIQIGRIVRRLVEGMGDFLTNGIHDDKQRSSFAREILQSLVELINNLAHEQQLDAWSDLVPAIGERQRVAGQLLQSLEGAAALLAYHQQASSQQLADQSEALTFLKVTDNVYVTIKTLALGQQQQSNRTMEVSFPSDTSLLGTKWMNSDQRYTVHLQTALGEQPTANAQVDVKYSADEQQQLQLNPGAPSLKIVFVMLRGLGAQMEPMASASQTPTESNGGVTNRVIVNSNLVSLSIVPDSRYKFAPIKVHLSAPIELIFKHLQEPSSSLLHHQSKRSNNNGARCAYWDTTASDWLSDGCKLMATNRTHSTCACDHLTSFALLMDWGDGDQFSGGDGAGQNHQPRLEQPRVQLDNVENELILSTNKMLYLARLLDGHLFGSSVAEYQQQQPANNVLLLIYISCLFSAALLALHLAAAVYTRAHARRLLGAIPAHPPPPTLLVSGGRPLPAPFNSDSSPTYSSDYSAALAATKTKLEAEEAAEAYDSQVAAASSAAVQGPKVDGQTNTIQLRVPIRLLAQLLTLQLLLVLLVESQNYLSAQRRSLRHSQHPLAFMPLSKQSEQVVEPLDPIGPVTWLLVSLLYYLVSATTCWLAAQLIQLNLELLPGCAKLRWLTSGSSDPSHSSASSSGGSSDKSTNGPHYDSSQLSSSNAHHHQGVSMFGRQAPGSNLYGTPGGGCFSQTATATTTTTTTGALHSANSPTSSFSSTADQHTALSRLEDSTRLYGTTGGALSMAHHPHLGLLRAASGRRRLLAFVEHALGPLLVGLVCWLSASGLSRQLNTLAFTTSFWAQVAHWPLLVDATLEAFAVLLYYGPALCLLLAGVALLLLGRAPRKPSGDNSTRCFPHQQPNPGNLLNPYGTSSHLATINAGLNGGHPLTATNHFLPGGLIEQHAAQLNKQSAAADNTNDLKATTGNHWHRVDSRKAKFLCTMLLGLLALHSISWISLFGHIHQTLNSQHPSNYHLILAFAISNLLLVLLLSWSQRRHLRRAAQLTGLVRLLGRICLCGSSCSSSQAARERARFYRNQHANGKTAAGSSSALKVSPSGQSLFIVSQVAQQQQQQQQQQQHQQQQQQQQQYGTTSYHYGSPYASGQQIYQQHIYESATALNEQQHRLNMMQLIQQQQQLHQMNQLDNHNQLPFNRSLSSLQQQLATTRPYNGAFDGQQQHQLRQHMTLKPAGSILQPMISSQRHSTGPENQQGGDPSGQLLVGLEPASQVKQQQFVCNQQLKQQANAHLADHQRQSSQSNLRQLPGEADGPLVAFNSSSQPPTTFGPSTSLASSAAALQGPQNLAPLFSGIQHHQQQQQQKEQRPTEHQQFNGNRQQQHSSQSSSPINCISERCSTSVADANQHQYYSINGTGNSNTNHKPQQQQQLSNYADALKLAMIQQQQNESSVSHHFRRTSSRQTNSGQHQLVMIDRNNCVGGTNNSNIYDVANFATMGQ